jgi:hypothetical protein
LLGALAQFKHHVQPAFNRAVAANNPPIEPPLMTALCVMPTASGCLSNYIAQDGQS